MTDMTTEAPKRSGKKTKEQIAAEEAELAAFQEANHLLSMRAPEETLAAINASITPEDIRTGMGIVMDVVGHWLKRGRTEHVMWLMDNAPLTFWPPAVTLALLSMAQPHGKEPVGGFEDYRQRVAKRWPDLSHLWGKR